MLLQRRKNVFLQDAVIIALVRDAHDELLLEELRLADEAIKSLIGINLSRLPRRIQRNVVNPELHELVDQHRLTRGVGPDQRINLVCHNPLPKTGCGRR